MTKLVGGGAGNLGPLASPPQFGSHRLGSEPSPVVGEEELTRPASPRVRKGPSTGTQANDAIDQLHRLILEWNHALGVEFGRGHLEPGAIPWNLVDAVEFEIEELSDP